MNVIKTISFSALFSLVLVFSFSLFLVPNLSYADGETPISVSEKIKNPLGSKFENLNDFVKTILEGVVKILLPIVALAIIYAGMLFVTARGNAEQITKAKNALLYSVIGAGLVLGAWALSILISDTVIKLNG